MTSTTEEITDPFVRLANVLNKIPNGFSIIEDGTHLKILKWIFSPEEADLTSKLKLRGETVEEIANRLELPIEGLEEKLNGMVKKGQIRKFMSRSGNLRFQLMPFVVGIWEDQVNRMDEEFAQLTEEYFQKSGYPELFGTQPAVHKVIPINKTITPELTIHPYQDALQMIENAQSWGVRECICKKHQKLLGNTCNYSKNVCMTFAPIQGAFDKSNRTKAITKTEALDLLHQTEEEGLIHNSMNVQAGQNYICNCCSCCCGVIHGLTKYNQPAAFVNSEFQINVDEELCIACGDCVDRCHFHALEVDDTCTVDLQKCVGCGVCAVVCEEGALSLVSPEHQVSEPPQNLKDWMTKKAMARRVNPSDII
ncbi:MAG: ATP-binding protein [Candidatus Kariarchaeaceae archaeon]|jgi:ferredoxin